MHWKCVPILALLLSNAALVNAQSVRVGVLGIYHPRELTLESADGDAIIVAAAGQTLFLQPRSASGVLNIRAAGDILLLRYSTSATEIRATELHAAGRNQDAANFALNVPGKMERRYRGILDVKIAAGELVPVVTMDLETAVASVVQAESFADDTPLEALKAQAIVTRSYFVAGGGRHTNFDFCDLTHCQVLREPPRPESLVAQAVAATRGLIVSYNEKPVTAMFTRSCAGHTLTPAEIGITSRGYPYFSVVCDFCSRNPEQWRQRVSLSDAAILSNHHEAARLAVDRRLGWNVVLSNNFKTHASATEVILDGVGRGHGVGLCQRGSSAMATGGATFREIIAHYFPNTTLTLVVPPPQYTDIERQLQRFNPFDVLFRR